MTYGDEVSQWLTDAGLGFAVAGMFIVGVVSLAIIVSGLSVWAAVKKW